MQNSDYSLSSRLLHRLALGAPFVAQTFFDLERALRKTSATNESQHVFVSGLARSGTTILLRALYETGKFRSLTYRDMPFVLMPTLWKQLSKNFQRRQSAKERAQGDRIMVDPDSPEAFEEAFWRIYCGSDYIAEDRLKAHGVEPETLELFRQFVAHVIASADTPEQKRYLSKNNNNLLRLSAIRRAFPNALILIPFRNPVQQAGSLLKQHRLFSHRHRKDGFSRDYMRWLGHHEFGLNHKPFDFGTAKPITAESDNINYWLGMWRDTYKHVLRSMPEGSLLVCYEQLCAFPDDTWARILKRTGINLAPPTTSTAFSASISPEPKGVDSSLRSETMNLYAQLSRIAALETETS